MDKAYAKSINIYISTIANKESVRYRTAPIKYGQFFSRIGLRKQTLLIFNLKQSLFPLLSIENKKIKHKFVTK
ncbi:MAG TPA: hypothetical protein DDZ96_05495 [Porphyromonadaceae bacterium]|nr:hypothetical protein [Porphyromonadaceae bacterium]HBK32176.1 hypothetical protein [Porphyromonadaceae bacterium]HBL33259.1 hypothetical protein [Porphyromonadaceae bacterium]HBX19168.1 hypothetical protein [Porphyromonadaceae bacterium]HBX44545.1 hypothetical protein [Porphyromonadaceae bacterium]